LRPQKVLDTLGADILRLWVGQTDYSGELSIRTNSEARGRVVPAHPQHAAFSCWRTSPISTQGARAAGRRMAEIDRYAWGDDAGLQAALARRNSARRNRSSQVTTAL